MTTMIHLTAESSKGPHPWPLCCILIVLQIGCTLQTHPLQRGGDEDGVIGDIAIGIGFLIILYLAYKAVIIVLAEYRR